MKPLQQIEALIKGEKYVEAEALANRLRGDDAIKLSVLASIAAKQEDFQRAEVLFERSLQVNPDQVLTLTNYSKMLVAQKKFKLALPLAERALLQCPEDESLALTVVQCLADLDRFHDATKVMQPFVERPTASLGALITQSSILRADLRAREALNLLQGHAQRFQENVEFQRALADVYAELDPDEAATLFEKVGAQKDSIPLRWNRSFVELRRGNFALGWSLYDAGLTDKIGKIGRPLPAQVRRIPMITELSQVDPTKWTVFSAEQGLGDQVIFLSVLREALQAYPKSVFIGEDRTVKLLERSFPGLPVYPYAFGLNLEKQGDRINGIFPIGSLMKFYRKDAHDYEKTQFPYLLPNVELSQRYRAKLEERFGKKKIIGLSWRGGHWDRQKRTKSLDFVSMVRTSTQVEDCGFVCLQYGDSKEEERLRKEHNLPVQFISGLDFKKQLDEWLALANACDGIASVSTALVHFCGAFGKKVDLLLGDGQQPFVWGTQPGQSLMYPSIRIHRKIAEETTEDFISRAVRNMTCLST